MPQAVYAFSSGGVYVERMLGGKGGGGGLRQFQMAWEAELVTHRGTGGGLHPV